MRYDGDIQPLIDWVKNGRPTPTPSPEFQTWMETIATPVECRARFEYKSNWILTDTPLNPDDNNWVKGYPHQHMITMGWDADAITTLVYLIAPEEGGEFALGGESPNDDYELTKVEPGLVMQVDSRIWHGVLPVLKGERMALVTVGHPK